MTKSCSQETLTLQCAVIVIYHLCCRPGENSS